MSWLDRFSGLREIVLAFWVVIAAPLCVSWAREAFTTERPLTPVVPVVLTELGEPEALHTRYGLSIVAMPAPPSRDEMAEVHAAGERPEGTLAVIGSAVIGEPGFESGQPMFACPEVRAIVSGDDAFAIIAWDDVSYVAVPGQTLLTPVGEVKLLRLRPRSLTLMHGDATMQCSLKR